MKTLFYHGNPVKDGRSTFAGTFNKNDELSIGISICSEGDNFVKKAGRDRAEKRSLGKSLEGKFVIGSVENNAKNFVSIAHALDRLSKKEKIRLFHLEKVKEPNKSSNKSAQ